MNRLGRVLVVLGILAALLVGVEFGVRALVGSQLQQALAATELELEQPSGARRCAYADTPAEYRNGAHRGRRYGYYRLESIRPSWSGRVVASQTWA